MPTNRSKSSTRKKNEKKNELKIKKWQKINDIHSKQIGDKMKNKYNQPTQK